MENHPAQPLVLDQAIRGQLPRLFAVLEMLDTRLAPSGERFIIYDSSRDDTDPHPELAVVVNGAVVKILNTDELVNGGGGFEQLMSTCEFQLGNGQTALALAFSTAFDCSGSAFAIVAWRDGDYRVVFRVLAAQARLLLAPEILELWSRVGMGECVWCQQHYQVRRYLLHDGKFTPAGITRLKRTYDPDVISSTPLMIGESTKGH